MSVVAPGDQPVGDGSNRSPWPRIVVIRRRPPGVVAELAADPPEVDVDGLRGGPERGVPDLPHQLLARDDLPGPRDQRVHQVELLAGEDDLVVAAPDAPVDGIESHVLHRDTRGHGRKARARTVAEHRKLDHACSGPASALSPAGARVDRLDEAEPVHRAGRQPAGAVLRRPAAGGGRLVDDHPVAPGDGGQPRRPGSPAARRRPRAASRPSRSPARAGRRAAGCRGRSTSMIPSAVSRRRSGSSCTNSTESPMLLITRPPLGRDDVGAAGLEHLDQVADPVLVELVGQRGEAHDVGEADGHLDGVQVLLVGARAPRPGPPPRPGGAARRRRAARSNGSFDLVDQQQRRRPIRLPGGVARPDSSSSIRLHQGGDLPVGQPGHGLADRAGQVDRDVEVDQARRAPPRITVGRASASALV